VTPRLLVAALCFTITALPAAQASLDRDLDAIFDDPVLARALVAARVESLGSGGPRTAPPTIYQRNADRLVVPASNMKLVTVAAAAALLGWNFRYDTRLESIGSVAHGVLDGDLVVTGSGDPSIGSPDGGHGQLFLSWADALRGAGIRYVHGRLIGDDNAFDDEGRGAGWAWDYLGAGYAAPAGALTYNEGAAIARITPGTAPGAPASVTFGPPGHHLELHTDVRTETAGSMVSLSLFRAPASPNVSLSGSVPAGGPPVERTAAVDNPTRFFVDALHAALASRGIAVSGGAWDIDDLASGLSRGERRTIAVHESEPLSALTGYALKLSQNLYAELFLKTMGRRAGNAGTTEAGRRAVGTVLSKWKIPADAIVMQDGSGLSRYNYLTAGAIVTLLTHVWMDEGLRGPFLAGLPVAGRDGSLELRMRGSALDRRLQAKTGTISNVRALSGYLDTDSGDKLVFSIIVNHFTAPNAAVDAIVERALARLVKGG
jgi:D-alanyl-D-alanine carboxypeptidase/D-alanyl-D-alanine-endopeptidase (penicillin-binding protein 4)